VDILARDRRFGAGYPREDPMRTLAAAFFALLITPLLRTPSPAQDKPFDPQALGLLLAQDKQEVSMEMKWTLQEGDTFDLKWGFSDSRKREPGRGETTESHDKREVDAELTWKAEGILLLTLKKVVWSYGSQDYEVALMYAQGKKLDPQQKMKIDTKAPGYAVSKNEADRMVDYMSKLTDGEFTIDTITEKGKTLILWNGGNVRGGGLSLFDKFYTHPLLPSGPVRVGQLFKDPLEVTNLPAGLTDVKTVESKVTAVGEKGAIAKGGFSVPVTKMFTANGATRTMSGNYTYSCEWNYSPKQYLQGAKEECKYITKVDAKGKDAAFYSENVNNTISQALSIKKKDPKPGEEKK
jgi:hypothetical protein